MPFEYIDPSVPGPLRQGEILSDVWEHRAEYPPIRLDEGTDVNIQPISHPRLIVMSQDCDLVQDFEARRKLNELQQSEETEREVARLLPHILLCELYERDEIRSRFQSDLWRRVTQNQDERYHCLPAAPLANEKGRLSEFFLDFKKILCLPTDRLYEGLESTQIGRVAVVPPIYLHDLIHRFYSFHSRVALPE